MITQVHYRWPLHTPDPSIAPIAKVSSTVLPPPSKHRYSWNQYLWSTSLVYSDNWVHSLIEVCWNILCLSNIRGISNRIGSQYRQSTFHLISILCTVRTKVTLWNRNLAVISTVLAAPCPTQTSYPCGRGYHHHLLLLHHHRSWGLSWWVHGRNHNVSGVECKRAVGSHLNLMRKAIGAFLNLHSSCLSVYL